MNMQRLFRWMPVVLATMGAMAWTAVAHAGDASDDVPKQAVKFADLNLGSLMGAATLYHRIDRAAAHVCGGPLDGREPLRAVNFASCKEQATERAVQAVNSTVLTSLSVAETSRAKKPITTARVPE